jgi:hypothetical protein
VVPVRVRVTFRLALEPCETVREEFARDTAMPFVVVPPPPQPIRKKVNAETVNRRSRVGMEARSFQSEEFRKAICVRVFGAEGRTVNSRFCGSRACSHY